MAEYAVVPMSMFNNGPFSHLNLQCFLNGWVGEQGLDVVSVVPVDDHVWVVLRESQ
jgi:hypothetical protein